jgi:hypothetical protein
MRRERRTTGNISATAWRMKLAVVSKNTRSHSEGALCQIDRAEDVSDRELEVTEKETVAGTSGRAET